MRESRVVQCLTAQKNNWKRKKKKNEYKMEEEKRKLHKTHEQTTKAILFSAHFLIFLSFGRATGVFVCKSVSGYC